jgi:dihydrofolate reductase
MKSRVSLILAMSENRVIGVANGLPWHLPAELRHFRAVTMGHPIIMGRKTHESIGRVLPGRRNIVVTRDPNYASSGVEVTHSLVEAIERCAGADEIFIIGGAELFIEAVDLAERIYLTLVHTIVAGDTYFQKLSPEVWRETGRAHSPADEKNPLACEFIVYERTQSPVLDPAGS